MKTKKMGFTLIELLVVIAIIGILAAMLFPVFARARESARKIQCLSNVKNIAIAYQMYLTDYDRFPPFNKDAELGAYLENNDGGYGGYAGCAASTNIREYLGSNPYLRVPVILDEYIKNRAVWACPAAKEEQRAGFIMPEYTTPWWDYYRLGGWGYGTDIGGPCEMTWPPGWGGSVTDSIGQQLSATGDDKTFRQSICANDLMKGKSTSFYPDPSKLMVCQDTRMGARQMPEDYMVYGGPGNNGLECGYVDGVWCNMTWGEKAKFASHLGGLNVDLADGHASWYAAESFITKAGGWCTPSYYEVLDAEIAGTCPGDWYD